MAESLPLVALDQVIDRPGRRKPSAIKRRPEPGPLLNRPRRQFKLTPHRSGYRKDNPRETRWLILGPFRTDPRRVGGQSEQLLVPLRLWRRGACLLRGMTERRRPAPSCAEAVRMRADCGTEASAPSWGGRTACPWRRGVGSRFGWQSCAQEPCRAGGLAGKHLDPRALRAEVRPGPQNRRGVL